jgi:hypothetical protein
MAGNIDRRAALIRIATFLGGLYFFLYFLLPEAVLSELGIQERHESISNGFIVVGAMAIGLGLINLVMGHGGKVAFKRPGWGNSLILLVALVAMLVITCGQWMNGLTTSYDIREVQLIGEFANRIIEDDGDAARRERVLPLPKRISALTQYTEAKLQTVTASLSVINASPPDESRKALIEELQSAARALQGPLERVSSANFSGFNEANQAALKEFIEGANRLGGAYSALRRSDQSLTLFSRLYDVLYNGLFVQLGAAMFALLGVYIAAAAYRAFRVKTLESALMMTAAVVVMLGQISAVFLMLNLGSFGEDAYRILPKARQWLLEVPNSAAFRAIRLGAGVAGLMLAIRMWLSIESKSFGVGKKG